MNIRPLTDRSADCLSSGPGITLPRHPKDPSILGHVEPVRERPAVTAGSFALLLILAICAVVGAL